MKRSIHKMGLQHLARVNTIEASASQTPWTKELFYNCLLLDYDSFVVFLEDTLIGYCVYRCESDTFHLLNISIAEEFRNQGHGKWLMKRLIQTATSLPDISTMKLEVRINNTVAIALYEQLGFKAEKRLENYYKNDDGTKSDGIVYLRSCLL